MAILLELLKDGLSGKTVVELGSGTGAVGLAAAALGLIFVILSFFLFLNEEIFFASIFINSYIPTNSAEFIF